MFSKTFFVTFDFHPLAKCQLKVLNKYISLQNRKVHAKFA